MLHYTEAGTQRSPNDQADLIRSCNYLKERCEFITLNQAELPSEIGHIESIRRLYHDIKTCRPDIVHIIGVKEGFHCAVAAKMAGIKKRILITRGFAGYTSVISKLRRLIFRWFIEPLTIVLCSDVHCNSRFSASLPMIQQYARHKNQVIYNFLNITPTNPNRPWRKEHNLTDNDFVVVTVGNMHRGKGYDILQKAIDHFKHRKDVKFVIIGDGPLKENFDNVNAPNLVSGRVMSLGALPHTQAMQIVSEADIFFLPSRYESLGMVFAEAAAYGVPCIGTAVGGIPEIIENGRTGFINPIEDVNSAITQIQQLSQDNILKKKMGNYAHDRIKSLFDSDKIGRQIFELYMK